MKSNKTLIVSAVAVIALMGASFYGGMLTQKALAKTSSNVASGGGFGGSSGPGGGAGGGGGGFRRNGVFGTVQSISGTTMVVMTQSGTKTVSLANNPTVSDSSGGQASISSIQTGDTVVVVGSTGSDGTVTATRVRLNPMAGGGGSGAAPGSTQGSYPVPGSNSSNDNTPSGT